MQMKCAWKNHLRIAWFNHLTSLKKVFRNHIRKKELRIRLFKFNDDIHGPFGYWSELVFPSSCSTRPKGAPLQGTTRYEPPPNEKVSIFRWGLWNTWISSRPPSLQLLLSMFSRKGWKNFGQKSLLISPPILPAYDPLTVIISICYPTPCSICVVSPGPLWPTFYHYKSKSRTGALIIFSSILINKHVIAFYLKTDCFEKGENIRLLITFLQHEFHIQWLACLQNDNLKT